MWPRAAVEAFKDLPRLQSYFAICAAFWQLRACDALKMPPLTKMRQVKVAIFAVTLVLGLGAVNLMTVVGPRLFLFMSNVSAVTRMGLSSRTTLSNKIE